MFSAMQIQAVLLGSGGFIGTCMAGVGAFKLFSAATRHVMKVPATLDKSAESLERMAQAIESQNAVSDQVMELKGLLMTTREEIQRIGSEREQIGRELRLMSRKIDAFSCYAPDDRQSPVHEVRSPEPFIERRRSA